jgi:hypothetical protein
MFNPFNKNNIYMLLPAILLVAGFVFPVFPETKLEKLTTADKSNELPTVDPLREDDINVHSLGLGIGQGFMMGDFSDVGADDLSWDVLYNYSASHSFDLLVNFHHNKYAQGAQEITLTGLAASVKGKFFHFDSFIPYALGGLGLYAPRIETKYNDGSYHKSKRKMVFGINFGTGLDLKLNRHFRVGGLLQLHNPFDLVQEDGQKIEGAYYKILFTTLYSF